VDSAAVGVKMVRRGWTRKGGITGGDGSPERMRNRGPRAIAVRGARCCTAQWVVTGRVVSQCRSGEEERKTSERGESYDGLTRFPAAWEKQSRGCESRQAEVLTAAAGRQGSTETDPAADCGTRRAHTHSRGH